MLYESSWPLYMYGDMACAWALHRQRMASLPSPHLLMMSPQPCCSLGSCSCRVGLVAGAILSAVPDCTCELLVVPAAMQIMLPCNHALQHCRACEWHARFRASLVQAYYH